MATNVNKSSPEAHLNAPQMVDMGGFLAPLAPRDTASLDIDPQVLSNLMLKLAYTASTFTTESAAERLAISLGLAAELLEGLRSELLVEVLGPSGPFGYRLLHFQAGARTARHG